MNPDEIPRLIAEIALADPRIQRQDPGELRAQVRMWAGILADVPYQAALDAAQQHYRESPWPILPADIATRWAATVRDRLRRHTDPKPIADPDDTAAWCRELGDTRRAVALGQVPPAEHAIAAGPSADVRALVAGIGWAPPSRHDPAHPYIPEGARAALNAAGLGTRPPEFAVACPVANCRAQPGRPCTRNGGRVKRDPHPSRADAWIAQQHAA